MSGSEAFLCQGLFDVLGGGGLRSFSDINFLLPFFTKTIVLPNSTMKICKILNAFLTLDQLQCFLIKQTFHKFHNLDTELDHHQITSCFHEAFVCGMPGGIAYPCRHLVPFPCSCSNS